MYCSNCGNKLSEDDSFCSKCGEKIFKKLDETPSVKDFLQAPPSQLKETDSSKGKVSIVFLIIGLLTLLTGFYQTAIAQQSPPSSAFIFTFMGSFFITISYICFLIRLQEKKKGIFINILAISKKNILPSVIIIVLVLLSIQFPLWIITFPIFYFIIKKTVQRTSFDEISTSSVSSVLSTNINKDNSMVFLTTGIIIFVIGLIAIIMRVEITVKIIGRSRILQDAFFGGGSTKETLTVVIIISAIAMILGLILFVKGMIKASRIK